MRKLGKIFLLILILYLSFSIIDRLFLLHNIDKSLETSYYATQLSTNQAATSAVYLVSYADRHPVFFQNQNAQAISAINNGIDHIMMYKRRDIGQDFYLKNKEILDNPMGAGLWLWKPYFILKTMEHAPENSIIVYADAPVLFKKPITSFLKLLKNHDVLVVRDGAQRKNNVNKVSDIIPSETLKYFHIEDPSFQKSDNFWACFVLVKNNDVGRNFIKQWLSNCEQKVITSTPSFDQAMLVIAVHQKPQGVYVMDVDEMVKVTKNVHRHPSQAHKSLLPDMVSGDFPWFKISEWGYNCRWVQWLRSIF